MGTHPIFESDFDCLTETKYAEPRSAKSSILPPAHFCSTGAHGQALSRLGILPDETGAGRRHRLYRQANRGQGAQKAKFYTLNAALVSSTVWFAANVVCKCVNVLNPSQDILALATVELELDQMAVGESGVFVWRGKPIFVKHRTPTDIKREESVAVSELRHPQADAERVVDPNWLVVIGICTHLGCVPIDNAGEFHGYYCPCHGSHYDASGRIRKGPAPLNLEVPPYSFTNPTTVLIG